MASKNLKAVSVAVVSMLCASVSYAQPGYTPPQTISPNNNSFSSINRYIPVSPKPGNMYVACRAEVPSNNTAYFSAMYQVPAVSSARKEFRELVTTQYGAVSQVQCVGKFNAAVVKDTVQQWKDKARATANSIIDTDWQPTAARDQGGRYLDSDNGRMKQTRDGMQPFPHVGGLPPDQGGPRTVASYSNGQRY